MITESVEDFSFQREPRRFPSTRAIRDLGSDNHARRWVQHRLQLRLLRTTQGASLQLQPGHGHGQRHHNAHYRHYRQSGHGFWSFRWLEIGRGRDPCCRRLLVDPAAPGSIATEKAARVCVSSFRLSGSAGGLRWWFVIEAHYRQFRHSCGNLQCHRHRHVRLRHFRHRSYHRSDRHCTVVRSLFREQPRERPCPQNGRGLELECKSSQALSRTSQNQVFSSKDCGPESA